MEIRFKDRKSVTTAAKMSLSKNAFFLIKDDVEGNIWLSVFISTSTSLMSAMFNDWLFLTAGQIELLF